MTLLDIQEVLSQQKHLNDSQKQDLKNLFEKYDKVFNGTLGLYPHKKVSIEIEKDAKLVHKRAYAVPRTHMDTFKKELDHLVEIGVLSHTGMSAWAMTTFIISKKDGRVRWVSCWNPEEWVYQIPAPTQIRPIKGPTSKAWQGHSSLHVASRISCSNILWN